MSLIIRVRVQADRDIDEIVEFIGRRDANAAIRFLLEVHRELKLLAKHPGIGTLRPRAPRELRGIRFIPMSRFRNYLLFYLVTDRGLDLIRVLHGARNIGHALRQIR